MNDTDFLARLADCSLDPVHFDHAGHLRLARLMLARLPLEAAVAETCRLIAAYASHLGAANKFHWTVTEALVRLLQAHGEAALADAPALLARHYSAARLADPQARQCYLAPDLLPLAQ